MFFMMGITEGRRDLEYDKMVICGICGRYGRYTVFMTYTVLSLFLIPVFKWNRRYFIRMSCCDTIYSLNPEKGRRIERGEDVEIEDSDISIINRGAGQCVRICPSCGYRTQEDFEYCPKCGQRLR